MSSPFQQIVPRDFQGNIDKRLLFFPAYRALKKIMYFPVSDEQKDYLFVYPPFRTDRGISNHEKGFACVESVKNENHELEQLTKQKSKKNTLFFDEYQKSAINYNRVME